MRFDERAQSVQIGAVLLFAALILALAGYQAFVVPQQNEGVEFSHSQQVQNQLSDLRDALVSAPGGSDPQSVSLQLGTRYPQRLLAVNPGSPTGSIRTSGTADSSVAVGVSNAEATGETGDYWDGTEWTYTTGWLRYRPNYNVYSGAPTTYYETSVLFNEFPSGAVPLTAQSFVDGNRVSLIALNGSLDVTRTGAASVDVRPVSTSTTTVAVENTTASDPIEIRVPTHLSLAQWDEILESEKVANGGHVTSLATEPLAGYPDADLLVVTLETNVTYDLQLAKAGVGSAVTDTSETYATDAAGNRSSVPEEGSQLLTVEVRDAYNNPVSGVGVEGTTDGGTLVDDTATTGADGRATFLYEAPTVTQETEVAVDFTYDGDPTAATFDPEAPENVGMTVFVQNTQAGGAGGGGPGDYQVSWNSPSASEGGSHLSDCTSDGCTWDVGEDGDINLDLTAGLDEDIEEATVDFALNNSMVATISPSEATTDGNGDAATTLTAQENGTLRLYAVSGGSSDVINVTVENITDATGEIRFRVDDLTHLNQNQPEFVASYDVQSFDDADSIEIEFSNTDSEGASETSPSQSELRGNYIYTNDYGADDEYDITLTVYDSNGIELASRTISGDIADAQNPQSQNDELSQSGSPTLQDTQASYTVDDRGDSSGPHYRYTWDVYDPNSDFRKVKLLALNLDGSSSLTADRLESDNNVDLEPQDGEGDQYRVGFMVYDGSGAVVEVVDTLDVASDSNDGPETVLSGTVLILTILGISGIGRRRGG